jgi:hypothetical protein
MTDQEAQMQINQEHDDRTRKDQIICAFIACIILLWTFVFCTSHP